MKKLDQLAARIDRIERILEQMHGAAGWRGPDPQRKTITVCVKRAWNTDDLLRFCQAVSALYGIFLVQSESHRDEECQSLLLDWDKSTEIVLAYRKANDANYVDGHLLIESVALHSRGMISLRGWTAPMESLQRAVEEVSRHRSAKKQIQVALQILPRTKLLSAVERRRLVAILLRCVVDLQALDAAVC